MDTITNIILIIVDIILILGVLYMLFYAGVVLWAFGLIWWSELTGKADEPDAPVDVPEDGLELGVGAMGTALSDLRPNGTAQFDGTSVNVVAVDETIDEGRAVRIVQIDDDSVYVEPVADDEAVFDAGP